MSSWSNFWIFKSKSVNYLIPISNFRLKRSKSVKVLVIKVKIYQIFGFKVKIVEFVSKKIIDNLSVHTLAMKMTRWCH